MMEGNINILLTGSTGYIGRRLAAKLLEDPGVQLRLFVRNKKKVQFAPSDKLEIFEGNATDMESLVEAVSGIDVAYYLIHSMGTKADYRELDKTIATNFREACICAGVKRIVYLGGLGIKETASKHLLSRIETGEILSAKPDLIQTIFLRAAIIIGSGSASFEIIRNLVQKLPFMITPRFVHTRTQPISVSDVLEYLSQAKDLKGKSNQIVDIGSEQMSFKNMLQRTAKLMGLRRLIIPVPVFTPKLSSYWLVLMTSVPYRIASALIEGLRSETIVQNENAKRFFPDIHPVSFDEAIQRALDEVE
ncbi:MAG TPA: NAD(P)H-binding protein [Candidatus Heimdallarchaeota archaeon]|nr:NAD(P)H-binding protein [Candidatus Heimdallarchaeota archaeon]